MCLALWFFVMSRVHNLNSYLQIFHPVASEELIQVMVSSAHCCEKTNFFDSTIHLHEKDPSFFLSRKRLKVSHSVHDNSVSHLCIGNFDVALPSQPSTQECTLYGYCICLMSLVYSSRVILR